jgi:hypothetical protein
MTAGSAAKAADEALATAYWLSAASQIAVRFSHDRAVPDRAVRRSCRLSDRRFARAGVIVYGDGQQTLLLHYVGDVVKSSSRPPRGDGGACHNVGATPDLDLCLAAASSS